MVGAREGLNSIHTILRPLSSPESIHLLHIIQGDHAISQDDVQQTIRAEQKLTT